MGSKRHAKMHKSSKVGDINIWSTHNYGNKSSRALTCYD